MADEVIPDPAAYSVHEVLRDGGSIYIRAIRPDDRERLLAHFKSLSEQSKYYRFFGVKRDLSEAELIRFTELDFVNHVGVVATLRENGNERFIGVGRYVRGEDPTRAEVAFAVLDQLQGRGIGTLLLEHLTRIARAAGIREFEADILGDNNRMLEVLGKSGFRVRRTAAAGVIHVAFPTAETEESAAASTARELSATAHSVDWILRPRSVAVIGASRDRAKLGGAILENLMRSNFTGAIYPINRAVENVQGLRCYPSFDAIGAPVDLAVIVVPAAAVKEEMARCARAGVHAVIVITAGFAELDAAGRTSQRELFELARGTGMRLVGPNCMGVLNTDPDVRLNATFAPGEPPVGNIGMFSQSGALGIAILDHMRRRRLGLSSFVSAGNRADVSNNDLIAWWGEDQRTDVILLYLESVGNPRRFARIAREVAQLKPIIAIKSGRSTAGTRAASSHSASFGDLDLAVDALFEQAGVIRTDTLEELFDVAAMLSTQPAPAGPRVGVVTNAGGPAILLADACESRGLILPPLAPATLGNLHSFLPSIAGDVNPIDMTVEATADDYARAIAAVGNDPSVDAVVAIYVPPMITRPGEAAAAIARGSAQVPAEKPVLSVFLSTLGPPDELSAGPRGVIPVFGFPENAAMALAAAWRHRAWRNRPRGQALSPTTFARDTIRSVIDRVLAGASDPKWLSQNDLTTVLRAAGIEIAQAEETSLAEVPTVASRVGFPLVVKAIVPGVPHKSDVGGIVTGIDSPAAAARAAEMLRDRMSTIGAQFDGVILQRQVDGGIEMMAGVTSDPTFGPLVVCGPAGPTVELLRDLAFRLHPVTDVDAAEMLTSLRSNRLLDGYRGMPAGDRSALIGQLMRISALIEIIPEMTELDLNPIKVLQPGRGAIVVNGRLLVTPLR